LIERQAGTPRAGNIQGRIKEEEEIIIHGEMKKVPVPFIKIFQNTPQLC